MSPKIGCQGTASSLFCLESLAFGSTLSLCPTFEQLHGDPSWAPQRARGKESCPCRRHRQTQVRSLGREDPLEEEVTTHSGILAGKLHGRGAWWASVHGVAKSPK